MQYSGMQKYTFENMINVLFSQIDDDIMGLKYSNLPMPR